MWFRRRPTVDVDASRVDRGASADDRDFSINCALGGFGVIGLTWPGTSVEDVRDSFAQYLYNHDEFAEFADPSLRTFRSLYVRFNGQHRLLTFRTDWITGFSVH